MIEQLLTKLTATDRRQAISAWHEVRRQSDKLRTLQHKQFQSLIDAAERACDEGVFRQATIALMHLMEARRHAPGTPTPAMPVVDWLWQPFRQASLVISTSPPMGPRPDEAPEFYVGRLLNRERSPKLNLIQCAESEQALWKQIASDRGCKAVCILGRLGPFADESGRLVGNRIPRFRVLPTLSASDGSTSETPQSPSSLGEVGREFHIAESCGPSQAEEYHPRQTAKHRTDYALVERYRVVLGGRPVAVVRCAGCTPLGTLAAARWACEELLDAASFQTPHPILLPKGTSDTSQLFALIQVTASTAPNPWEPKRLEVKKLFIDNWAWDAEDESWSALPVQEITLIRRGGTPLRFLFDGCAVNTRRESEAFSLLATLVESKDKGGTSRLDRDRIAKKLDCSQKELSRQLSLLKCRRLHDALEVDDDDVILHAATSIIDERNAGGLRPRQPR